MLPPLICDVCLGNFASNIDLVNTSVSYVREFADKRLYCMFPLRVSMGWWHLLCFVFLCPIGEQFLLSSFREFVHDGYYLATVARFVHQAFLTRNERTIPMSQNVSGARNNSICTEKILFLTDHNV